MQTKELIKSITDNYSEADVDQLEHWLGELSSLFAWTATQLGEVKKNRALKEIEIGKKLIQDGERVTEKMIERLYYSSEEGQYLALNQEYLKAFSKLISSIRFRIEALRGRI